MEDPNSHTLEYMGKKNRQNEPVAWVKLILSITLERKKGKTHTCEEEKEKGG